MTNMPAYLKGFPHYVDSLINDVVIILRACPHVRLTTKWFSGIVLAPARDQLGISEEAFFAIVVDHARFSSCLDCDH